jgi:hypothetical protein
VETKRENENRERLRELAAKIAAEQDHGKFVVLVKEMNQLLQGELRKPQASAPSANT